MSAADNPHQPEIDRAVADKAAADALTAAANARKAQYEAEISAAKARIGELPTSGVTGTADIAAAGVGGAEGNLLAAMAVRKLADTFSMEISQTLASGSASGTPPSVLVVSSTTVPDFQAYSAFLAQTRFFQAAFDEALKSADPAELGELESPMGVALGLDAVSKLLSFAKTDYKFTALNPTATDAMLATAIASKLATRVKVEAPATFFPDMAGAAGAVYGQLNTMLARGVAARGNQSAFERRQAELEKKLGATPTDAQKKDLAKVKAGSATWKTVADAIDSWAKLATTSDDKGANTLATILRQGAVQQKLESGAHLLVVQLHSSGGAGYAKKNLLSSLGANPFYVMGGVVAGYTLYEGRSGRIVAANMQPYHGGYRAVDEVQTLVNPSTEDISAAAQR